MAEFSRREFILLGTAAGAAVAVGVVVPLSIATRDRFGSDGTGAVTGTTAGPVTTAGPGTTQPDVMGVVTTFPRLEVARLGDLQEAVPVTFDYPLQGQGNILVKTGRNAIGGVGPDEDIVAFSRICTHMGCELIEYQGEHGVLGPCPCHFSTFDLVHNAQVTLGQATQNLPQVLLEIDEDSVYATGVIRLVYGYANTLEGGEMVNA